MIIGHPKTLGMNEQRAAFTCFVIHPGGQKWTRVQDCLGGSFRDRKHTHFFHSELDARLACPEGWQVVELVVQMPFCGQVLEPIE